MELKNFPTIFVHQDTESDSREMPIGVAGPIFTQKNLCKAVWENGIHTLQYERKIL